MAVDVGKIRVFTAYILGGDRRGEHLRWPLLL